MVHSSRQSSVGILGSQSPPAFVIWPPGSKTSVGVSTRPLRPRRSDHRHSLLKSELSPRASIEKDLSTTPGLSIVDTPGRAHSRSEAAAELSTFDGQIWEAPGTSMDERYSKSSDAGKSEPKNTIESCDIRHAGAHHERALSPDSQDSLTRGALYKSGGAMHEMTTEISRHGHGDHSSVIKVRPTEEAAPSGCGSQGRRPVSKVRSAGDRDDQVVHDGSIFHSYSDSLSGPTPQSFPRVRRSQESKVWSCQLESHTGHLDHFPRDVHEGHVWVHKVQSFNEAKPKPAAPDTALYSIPHLVSHPVTSAEPKENSEARKAASYWGFLP